MSPFIYNHASKTVQKDPVSWASSLYPLYSPLFQQHDYLFKNWCLYSHSTSRHRPPFVYNICGRVSLPQSRLSRPTKRQARQCNPRRPYRVSYHWSDHFTALEAWSNSLTPNYPRFFPIFNKIPRTHSGLLEQEIWPVVLHVAWQSTFRRDLWPPNCQGPYGYQRRSVFFSQRKFH
jgi:hypothetical protein